VQATLVSLLRFSIAEIAGSSVTLLTFSRKLTRTSQRSWRTLLVKDPDSAAEGLGVAVEEAAVAAVVVAVRGTAISAKLAAEADLALVVVSVVLRVVSPRAAVVTFARANVQVGGYGGPPAAYGGGAGGYGGGYGGGAGGGYGNPSGGQSSWW
jgi:hypothetical protein